MSYIIILILILLAMCLFPQDSLAEKGKKTETVALVYDDGEPANYFVFLKAGDIESMRFTPLHPFKLKEIEIAFGGDTSYEVEVHIWLDNGGHEPDFSKEVIKPILLKPQPEGEFTKIQLPNSLVFEPLRNFHVGIVHLSPEPSLLFDKKNVPEVRALVKSTFQGAFQWAAVPGDYLVRVSGEYYDKKSASWFEDITDSSGAIGGGRLAFGDYDNDGDDDLLVNGNRLFKNIGNGKFEEVTEEAKIGGKPTNGAVWGDYNNDGFLDFYATVNSLTEHDILYRNNGDGTFTDVSDSAGKPYDFLPTEAAAWGDIDNNGYIDLYVANYELPGENLGKATDDYLWKNNGDGTFVDFSEGSGIRKSGKYCGRGVNMGDFNNDGWIDIHVSNYRLNPNFLWQNKGDGTFSEVAFLKGVAGIGFMFDYGHTIGSVWGDVDRDGDLDLFAGNLAHPRFITFSDKSMLYINSGAPDFKFKDMREEAGIAYQETHSEPVLFDFDNDSLLDLFITCVYVGRESAFYVNQGGIKFKEESYLSGLYVENGWGAAAADIDNDGRLEIAANRIFLNKFDKMGNFLKVKLEGVQTNRAAIGARVTVVAGGKSLVGEVEGGKGTGNQNSLTMHFGLGEASFADNVTVRWTNGIEEQFGMFQANQTIILKEGEANPVFPEEGQEDAQEEDAQTPLPEFQQEFFDAASETTELEENEIKNEIGSDLQLSDIIDKKGTGGCVFFVYNIDKIYLTFFAVSIWISVNLLKRDSLSGNFFKNRLKKKRCS